MADDWFAQNAPKAPAAPQSSPAPSQSVAKTAAQVAAPVSVGLRALPAIASATSTFAQAPNAASVGGTIARTGTTLAALARGAMNGDAGQILAAPMEGWAAGKGGYWLTKGAQAVSKPIANALQKAAPLAEKALPYVTALSTAQAEGQALQRLNSDPELQQQLAAKQKEFSDWVKAKLNLK